MVTITSNLRWTKVKPFTYVLELESTSINLKTQITIVNFTVCKSAKEFCSLLIMAKNTGAPPELFNDFITLIDADVRETKELKGK
jgi:hypothetical protein